ncbi:hypothetical protein [Streptomyces sp. MW-W600-10]|uniref:hypothetical protein n=1 Tax=Streptomyces sp. MW-W600-10 TaxID=2829819 RepID=UPI001C43DBC6|nr:hypothetical protein [Streptomyces sp. MW-W600-10]MBV7248326.1 hypothetical protein [Streptomyces sp. MW-W600-10]
MLTSSFSPVHWWIAAAVSGIALAVAVHSMATTKKGKLLSASLPLVAAVVFLNPAAHGDGEATPAMLYVAVTLSLAATRVIFFKHIRHQLDLKRSGRPMEEMTGAQVAIFLLTLIAIIAAMAAFL